MIIPNRCFILVMVKLQAASTPFPRSEVENSLADLHSCFEFILPGYLASLGSKYLVTTTHVVVAMVYSQVMIACWSLETTC